MAYIYKITNTINDKIYIGYTSRSPHVRLSEHIITARHLGKYKDLKDGNQPTYLHNAMLKHGGENFEVETLQEINEGDGWGDLEKYYILKYNSNSKNIGYNLTEGGENPPIQYGESNVRASLTNEDFEDVIQLLREGVLTQREISEKHQVHRTTIERINAGAIRYNEKYNYPIRKKSPFELSALDIARLLVVTVLPYYLIAEILEINKATVGKVNRGDHHRSLFPRLRFPIRDNISYNSQFYRMEKLEALEYRKLHMDNLTGRQKQAFGICVKITNTDSSLCEIRNIFNFSSINVVNKINEGNTYGHLFDFFYFPLTDNKNKNKIVLSNLNAVETIPLIGK